MVEPQEAKYLAQLEEAKNQVGVYERGWRQAPVFGDLNTPGVELLLQQGSLGGMVG